MWIRKESLPNINTFFGHQKLRKSIQSMLTRFMISILVRHGRNSCMNAAEVLRDQPMHRAQPARFLTRVRWRAMDVLGKLALMLLNLDNQVGDFILILDSTMVGHQGQTMENTYSTGNRQRRPQKNRRYGKYKHARKGCHCFVFGLLLTPKGIRVPIYKPLYTKAYAQQKKLKHYTQAQLGAQIIDQVPVPDGASLTVLGDTAFDAKVVRQACDGRNFVWIFPCNTSRVFANAGGKRPRVSSRIKRLSKDRFNPIRIPVTGGGYTAQRRLSKHRKNAKRKTRTYYVHSESRQVHSVGEVLLVFSSTQFKKDKTKRESTKILMTNAKHLKARQVVELYCIRWQIELFFKELKSILGMDQYKLKRFDAVEGWMDIVLITFIFMEWTRFKKLSDKRVAHDKKEAWRCQRSYGIRKAILVGIEIRNQQWLQKRIKTPNGIRTIQKTITRLLANEYRCAT